MAVNKNFFSIGAETFPESLMNRLKKNEEILHKFHEIELSILSILNFHDFFEKLLTQISSKFSIPYTWLSIIENSHFTTQLKSITHSEFLISSIAFIDRDDFSGIIKDNLTPVLANTAIERYHFLFPENKFQDIGSIAIVPITLDGEVIGSINQADKNIYRFEPGIDTSLLLQLGLKISLCLSNVSAHEQLKYLAFHDTLTGLLNRGVMEKILEREFLRARRYHIDLSVIFLDLDDFKLINDTHGHTHGDRALVHLSNCLRDIKRDSDIIARFAGDEFVIILPSTSPTQAESVINRLHNRLQSVTLTTEKDPIAVKFSYGISSVFDEKIDSATALLKSADKRLYVAKQNKNKGL